MIVAETRAIADRVLRRLPLRPGDVVADVGCGDGNAGLAALERPGVRVVFVDVSSTLLDDVRALVAERGLSDRATFAVCDAESLRELADASVDAVITRASLAYVEDKVAAFRAAHRVVRPGGVLSLAEPVFRDAALTLHAARTALASADPDMELLHRWNALALPDTLDAIRANPLTNFDERSLRQFAEFAGFSEIRVRLHLDPVPFVAMPWNVALETALLPGAPTLRAALAAHYTADERRRFERRFRPAMENGEFPPDVRATAYLWAFR